MSPQRNLVIKQQVADLLHSISAKVNRMSRNLDADLPINLEELNDIRVITAKIELLQRRNRV